MHRAAFALFVAVVALAFYYSAYRLNPAGHGDFSAVWYGAKVLLRGDNPYIAVGPGKEFPYDFALHYPATALVAAAPLSFLSEHLADVIFVGSSAFLLAFGLVRENWNRVWILPSAAFIVAARSSQWSPLIAATYLIPSLGWAATLKPSTGLAAIAGNLKAWSSFLVGGILFSVTAFALYPHWLIAWLGNVSGTWEFSPPSMRLGGFLLPLAFIRWKQPEGRFLGVLSLVPQTSSWYEGLLPMLVARTKREAQVLSLISSLGYILLIPMALRSPTHEIPSSTIGVMMVLFCYLPALVVVLRRG